MREVSLTGVAKSIYGELPWEGSYGIGVGHALITMVEPFPGYERAYTRWYEDDHFWSGALYTPFMFAGRRWVATRDLQLLRYPSQTATPVVEPVTSGCYLSTYWIAPGRLEEQMLFVSAANRRLSKEGRKFDDGRKLVFSEFQDHVGTAYRDEATPRDVFALIDPYPGLVMEVIDADRVENLPGLERWLLESHLPARVQGQRSPAALALVFRTPPPKFDLPDVWPDVSNGGRRLTLLWFLSEDPRTVWTPFFAQEGELVAAGGKGRVSLVAPFIPVKMGTDTYVDQLR